MRSWGRLAWLLVVVGFVACSLGAASAGAGSDPERQARRASDATADEQRSVTSARRRDPRTARMRLRGGRVITVWRICVARKGIGAKKRAVETEADRLDPLERIVAKRETALRRFDRAHPEKALPPALYAHFQKLRVSYSVAVSRLNAQVARYNAAAKRHNDVLYACEV
jgi:hypothetical protein